MTHRGEWRSVEGAGNPCDLATLDEVSSVIGFPVDTAVPKLDYLPGKSTCTWGQGGPGNFVVIVGSSTSGTADSIRPAQWNLGTTTVRGASTAGISYTEKLLSLLVIFPNKSALDLIVFSVEPGDVNEMSSKLVTLAELLEN